MDLFYRNQGPENTGYANDDFLRRIARAAGLDVARAFGERDGVAAEGLLADAEQEADAAGIDSTPSFLVGRTGGALERFQPQSLDAGPFRAALDELLREL